MQLKKLEMKSLNKYILPFCLLFSVVLFTTNANAQCKRFTKKNCLPSLKPFTHNGKLTAAVFNPGETADLEMTFNAGKEYRVLVCSQELIGQVQFKVLDKTRKILFESEEGEENPFWDFKVKTTQQLIIQITVPEQEDQKNRLAQLTPNGCVSIMVGFK